MNQTADEYVDQIQAINDKLSALKAPIPESTLIGHIISSLNDNYGSAQPTLTLNAANYTLDTLRSALRSLAPKQQPQQQDSHPRALLSRQGSSGRERVEEAAPSTRNPWVDKICYHCGNQGHILPNCRLRCVKRSPNQPTNYAPGYPKSRDGTLFSPPVMQCPEFASAPACLVATSTPTVSTPTPTYEWVLDSGTSFSMAREKGVFCEYMPFRKARQVGFGNGSTDQAHGEGTIIIPTSHGNIYLSKVLYVPKLVSNLLSVSALVAQGYSSIHIEEKTTELLIFNKWRRVATASLQEGLYILNCYCKYVAHLTKEPAIMRWHKKLGHPNFGTLAEMQRKGLLTGCRVGPSDLLKAREEETCEPCMEGKMHRVLHQPAGDRASHINFRVHSDIMGPLKTPTLSGARYVLTLIDEQSGFSMVQLLKQKSDTLTVLPTMLRQFATQGGRPVKRLRTDRGGEYMSTAMEAELQDLGIWHEKTAAYTPEQNGKAERLNRTLMERTRTYLSESALPPSLWGHALHHANHVRNTVPYAPTGQPPYLYFTGEDPDINQLSTLSAVLSSSMCQKRSATNSWLRGRRVDILG